MNSTGKTVIRKYVANFTLAFWVALSFVNAHAQPPTKVVSSPPAVKEALNENSKKTETAIRDTRTEEVIELRTQNKLMQEFQGALLDTVLWALGVVSTIAVFIAGFGWWSNFKVYENDKKRLQEDLDASFGERIAQLELRLAASNTDLSRSIETRVDSALDRAHGDITALQTLVTELTAKLEVNSNEIAKGKKRDLEVQADLRRVEENIWEMQGIPANMLITQSQGLIAELEAELAPLAKWTLQRMKQVLQEKFIDTSKPISSGTKELVLSMIPLSSTVLGVEIAEVRTLIGKLKVADDDETS